jgi:hypothetical protein
MPKYTFSCNKCGSIEQKFTDTSTTKIDCTCGNAMFRNMPIIKGVKTTEVVDKYTNKKHVEDHKKIVEERKHDFYWSKEVPKMVNSGIYELSTMLEKGWVYYDDKGNLVTRTKPPQKE